MHLNSNTECEIEVSLSVLQKVSSGKNALSNLIAKACSFAVVIFLGNLSSYPDVFLPLWLKR